MFWDMLFAVVIGGLLVVSVVGYCGVIFWKWVLRDTLKSMEEAYEVYQSKLEQTFINKEEK